MNPVVPWDLVISRVIGSSGSLIVVLLNGYMGSYSNGSLAPRDFSSTVLLIMKQVVRYTKFSVGSR